MTKSIQQIKQDLSDLESAVAETAVELQTEYRNYLNLLSQSVKQQLILAGYQICTQFYPQSFLELSLSNKQDLQQALRQIGIEIQPTLLEIIEQQELEPVTNELNLMAELIKNLPKTKKQPKIQEDPEEPDTEAIDLESVKAELSNLENIEFIEIDTSTADISEFKAFPSETSAKQQVDFENPEHLIAWHKQIERKIKKTLDLTSKNVNKHLQDSGIIPNRIPSKIIDVALQTDGSPGGRNSRQLPNAPNVLHLAIETDRDKKSKFSKNMTQISLLRLRLAEIEFSDPMLNAKRGRIRNVLSKINKLNSQYKIVKHNLAVAEAQAAWRSSWYEE
ncbi:MAG: hypothetical protein QNJ72_34735 [Pleurocapsa sp. MO_226.B13]|nr:hypothetical protein [Pleurocapsa sp. MO_226.B13]